MCSDENYERRLQEHDDIIAEWQRRRDAMVTRRERGPDELAKVNDQIKAAHMALILSKDRAKVEQLARTIREADLLAEELEQLGMLDKV